MAAASHPRVPHGPPRPSPLNPRPREPSSSGIPVRPQQQPPFHNNSLQCQHHISLAPLPPPPPSAVAAPPSLVRPPVPVPSHSRPLRQPPRCVPTSWNFAGAWRSFRTRGCHHMPRSWGSGHDDLNLEHLRRHDDRRIIEVIANGLNLWGGAQLAIDTTLVSPLTREGQPRRHSGTYRFAAIHTARRNKERTYPELLQSRRCKLVVLAIEVGGRWSQEAATFIRLLAKSKARQAPAIPSSPGLLLDSHAKSGRHGNLCRHAPQRRACFSQQRRRQHTTPPRSPHPPPAGSPPIRHTPKHPPTIPHHSPVHL